MAGANLGENARFQTVGDGSDSSMPSSAVFCVADSDNGDQPPVAGASSYLLGL